MAAPQQPQLASPLMLQLHGDGAVYTVQNKTWLQQPALPDSWHIQGQLRAGES